jgi:hypothetical protein
MKRRRKLALAVSLAGVTIVLGARQAALEAARSQPAQAPMFEVDPMWPQPLGNHRILGSAVGVAVDSRDHVYVLNLRNSFNTRTEVGAAQDPPTGDCCIPAPDVIEFDSAGAVVGQWGGPGTGYQWPMTPRGLTVDRRGNLWIGAGGPFDTHILRFGGDGRVIAQYGKVNTPPETPPAGAGRAGRAGGGRAGAATDSAAGRGGRGGARGGGGGRGGGAPPGVPANSSATDAFGGAAKISIDAIANEGYVADGYRNRRVAVIDLNTGAIKRTWGAYGERPNDADIGAYDPAAAPARQFRTVTCAEPSTDGFVYVCDRGNNRIQVFRKDGAFVAEKIIAPNTRAEGSVWDIAFSRDPQQRYLYVADGRNMKVHILDRRSLQILTAFGAGGRQPGQFLAVHSIATDSKGNIYTVEDSQGKRVQKFVFKGIGPVTTANQGVVWPKGGQ